VFFSVVVGNGYDFIDNDSNPQDCAGHGTHVAGTIAGNTYGVAKKATIHSVRVLDCNGSGYLSTMLQGIDWVNANKSGPSVVNMSLGSSMSNSLNSAIQKSISNGAVYVVAAGNDNKDACNYSPASVSSAITVGATGKSDSRSSFSNYGSCVDIFAPGENIISANYQNNSGTLTMSGTSMAAPHVTGVVARYLSQNQNATASQVESGIKSWAASGKVSNTSGSANLLLGAPADGASPTPTPAPTNPTPTPTPTNPNPTPTPTPTPTTSVTADITVTKTSQMFYSSVKGTMTVKDSNGSPVRNARVTVKASGGINGTGSWYTNQNGQANFSTYVNGNGQTTFTITSVMDSSGKSLQFSGNTTKTI
jgi:subtilisin family serine protease